MSDSAAKTWLSSHKKPVPALDILHQKALETLNSKTASLSDLADIISLDPGMSIALFDKMNAKRTGKNRPRLESIHSILGLMGLPAVTDFVKNFQSLAQSDVNNDTCQAYHQLVSRSFHLMYQSDQLIELEGMHHTHEILAAAMLHNVAELYACLFDFQQYRQYQQACLPDSIAADHAESIFGFNFTELGDLISHELHLPDLAQEAQQPPKKVSRKARTLKIAADITQQAELGWAHDAFMQSLDHGAEYLEYPVNSLRKRVLATALDAARDFPVDDVFPAIARAILLPAATPPMAGKAVPASSEQTPLPTRASFSDKVKALIKLPTATQTGIVELLVKELAQELQLSRVALLLLSKDNTQLTTRMSQGLGNQSPLLKLQIKVAQAGLIKNLISKPQSLWVTSANYKKYEPLLPGSFRASSQSQNFFLMSLFIGEKPIGVIFCDSNNPLDEPMYKTFKSNLLLTAKALTFLAQRPRKAG